MTEGCRLLHNLRKQKDLIVNHKRADEVASYLQEHPNHAGVHDKPRAKK